MIFGLPIEVVTMLGSSLFSGVMTMWSQSTKDQMEFNKLALQANQQQHKQQVEQIKVDKGFTWTRRFIALAITIGALAMIFLPAILGSGTVIELTNETKGLFGLFSDKEVVYETVKGFVVPDWFSSAFTAVVGLYFGNSIVKK